MIRFVNNPNYLVKVEEETDVCIHLYAEEETLIRLDLFSVNEGAKTAS